MTHRIVVGGITTARLTRSQLANRMVGDCLDARRGILRQPKLLFSSNGSMIARYHLDRHFRDLVDQADIIDADGMPLVIASRIFCENALMERIATTDFIHDAAIAAKDNGLRFYFLGGGQEVAAAAAASLVGQHEGLQIAGTHHGYFSREEEAEICAQIRRSSADVLWLGMGSPYQEEFAIRNRHLLGGVAWIKTCGGMFDHLVGKTRRAPVWMQNAGLEWFSRLVQEPRRLAIRYLWSNPIAVYYLATQTFDMPMTEDIVAL